MCTLTCNIPQAISSRPSPAGKPTNLIEVSPNYGTRGYGFFFGFWSVDSQRIQRGCQVSSDLAHGKLELSCWHVCHQHID